MDRLLDALNRLTHVVIHLVESEHRSHGLVTRHDLEGMEKRIMATVKEYVAEVQAQQDRQDVAFEGLKADLKFVKDKLTAIENSPGTLSPEDQASLTAGLDRMKGITAKFEALDAETAPTPPTG